METTRAEIAIYKINYQSDFILTVVCDVEWGTPFCIKFWTGEPAQAYYVGWDGNEYRNCKVVESDPSKLLVLFDDHHLPVGELKMQIAYHTTIEDFPNAIVDEVTNSMKVMAYIDGKNQKIALDFEGEEDAELQFELPAYANEAQRIANEEQRIANEQARIEAEQQRIDNEQTRQNNEAQRIAQESARVNEYAGLKADAVAATDAANDAATLANQKAQLAADKAALADAAATLANQKAQLAADKAVLADAAATLANQKAEYADTQGDYAKEQGDYAKEQGDTALADHRRAESDHETATSDHTIAANDHTQAGNDHTRAESDHSTAADDHTLAASDHSTAAADHTLAASDHSTAADDHTLAASDHSTAANDHTQAGNDHTRAESDHTRAESDHAAVEVYVDSLGAFDISSYHATGGVLAKYADLTAALGTNGVNIPEAIRKGGMSVKFVHSSDNKYVQFRLMSDSFNTTPTNWQGVDDESTAGSINLITSGAVKNTISQKGVISGYDDIINSLDAIGLNNREKNGYADDENWLYTSNAAYKHLIIPIEAGQEVYIKAKTNAFTHYGFIKNYRGEEENGEIYWCDGTGRSNLAVNAEITITAPNDAVALYILKSYNDGNNLPAILTIDGINALTGNLSILEIITDVEGEQTTLKNLLENKADILQSVNLFNINSNYILNGYYIQGSGIVAASRYKCSHPIKVIKGKTYKYGNGANLYGNSKFLAEVSPTDYSYIRLIEASVEGDYNVFTADKDMLIRFNLGNSASIYNTIMLCEAASYPSEFTPYYRVLADYGNYNKNPLYGKKISFNGDSICAGVGFAGGYGKIIAERNNMIYENIAVGGATIVGDTYSGENPRHWISRTISNMAADADYIILEGGVNDASLNVTIGTEPSPYYSETFDDTQFVGALESMFKQCYARFAGKKLGFIITHGTINGWRYGIDDYVVAVKKCCAKWGIPYLDLQSMAPPMNFLTNNIDLSIKETYTANADGWHPNEQGYLKYYCDKIEAWLRTL